MNSVTRKQDIDSALKKLRLAGMRDIFEESVIKARNEGMDYADFLHMLLLHERDTRKRHRVERFLKASRLPLSKTYSALDLAKFPFKTRQKINAVLDGGFIERKENIIVFGPPGTGKTHLVCAIGQEQIKAGKRIFFCTAGLLVQRLLAAKKEYRLEAEMKKLAKYDAVIIDDIGYVQYERSEMEVLFMFLSECYELRSVMITSNLAFSKWDTIFKDPMTAAAAIDRLVHHCVIIELTSILSYRAEAAKKNNRKEKKET